MRADHGIPRVVALAAGAVLLTCAAGCADKAVFYSEVDSETDPAAAGISAPADASVFRSSAIGPDRVNFFVGEGSPLAYVERRLLDSEGRLPAGMSLTEAQSLQVLGKLDDLLTSRGLEFYEVGTVRAYLTPDGAAGADFDGWQRAYRRYFANIDRDNGDSLLPEPVETTTVSTTVALSTPPPPMALSTTPAGPGETSPATTGRSSTAPATTRTTRPSTVEDLYPGTVNPTRPTLVTVGVAQQPVEGWLVQVEIEVFHGED
ncbi:hypothetical protein Csp1_23110 [Corynebacterium provencense]|uniref:Uncharacterized protein n=1 Tax=Corynebacterium provencense TaxID=1737425 RepID=A0A2Z3YTN2_9CORY|nr:hypothetical protein [Corynebacterium provencense]AWT27061.1 hypothetical protein Csp1_23110 [Corynebacterium provencense]